MYWTALLCSLALAPIQPNACRPRHQCHFPMGVAGVCQSWATQERYISAHAPTPTAPNRRRLARVIVPTPVPSPQPIVSTERRSVPASQPEFEPKRWPVQLGGSRELSSGGVAASAAAASMQKAGCSPGVAVFGIRRLLSRKRRIGQNRRDLVAGMLRGDTYRLQPKFASGISPCFSRRSPPLFSCHRFGCGRFATGRRPRGRRSCG